MLLVVGALIEIVIYSNMWKSRRTAYLRQQSFECCSAVVMALIAINISVQGFQVRSFHSL